MQSLGKRGELSVELDLTGAYVVPHGYCVCLADVSCGRQVVGKKMSLRLEREPNKKPCRKTDRAFSAGSSGRARTYNSSVNSRVLYH